jgi:hypothetical protein
MEVTVTYVMSVLGHSVYYINARWMGTVTIAKADRDRRRSRILMKHAMTYSMTRNGINVIHIERLNSSGARQIFKSIP